ncbi:transcriptional regulator, LacI family [Filimonas lacunae]|uniref:Transcriptional regulator, LacI family n=1 Tax=Filimonas lacunae TaxID=477680 RepID=A0A173MGW8_9BACT|nr:LacI family DNA-binding transcriptional regulator [Filimonas lacunae]BAV06835.1 LacI family transcriptional regulator [Filimonas lacunae]SIS99092.1 transcriptional regulator, LacI family [Filimonas lacunae]
MKKRVTIADIARELNITPATVSRALSNHPEISAATKKVVQEAAEKLDYNRNKIASSLRSGRTNVIGVLIPTAEHIFFGSVIHGISNIASKNGYDILIYQSNESQQFEKKGIDAFISARVDGILASIAKDTTDFSHFTYAKAQNIPIAFFDRVNNNLGIPSITIDDYRGAYLATESLIKEGYTRIAHITGPQHIQTFKNRVRGYRDALQDYQLPALEEWVYEGNVSVEAGREGASVLLSLTNPPDAIVAVEDFTALGVLKELKQRNIPVPQQFGVFGFCNDMFGEHITPSLSTIDQQTVLMGEEAFKMMHELIQYNGAATGVLSKVLQPIPVIRESSRKTSKP